MNDPKKLYYAKRGEQLVKHLQSRHFEAYYCDDRKTALDKALSLIPQGASVGWGGTMSAEQIGLIDAVKAGPYQAIDRAAYNTQAEREEAQRRSLFADVFLTGANAISLDGQMVNIDGTGNRVAAIIYGPKKVIVIAGMNKVEDTLDAAMNRARTVAAPANKQRFPNQTPCHTTGTCADCKSLECICNQIVITRHCRPAERIAFVLVGEEIGL